MISTFLTMNHFLKNRIKDEARDSDFSFSLEK